MENWFLLHTTRNVSEANIIKGMLEENNLPVFVMNKQDSSYLNFGDLEIYVAHSMKELALQLVHNTLLIKVQQLVLVCKNILSSGW